MKTCSYFLLITIFTFLLLLLFYSCNKNDDDKSGLLKPTVKTDSVSSLGYTEAECGLTIISWGIEKSIEFGFLYATDSSMRVPTKRSLPGYLPENHSYRYLLQFLSSGTKYYLKAYAKNSLGEAYGKTISFKTLSCILKFVSTDVFYLSKSSASVDWKVEVESVQCSKIQETGIYWGKSPDPEITGTKIKSTELISFSTQTLQGKSSILTLNNLNTDTEYYIKAYVINIAGITFGEEVRFRTLPDLTPLLTTDEATLINTTSATCNGTILSAGGSPVTEFGFYFGTSKHPETSGSKIMIGTSNEPFKINLSGLNSETQYFFTAYATNSFGVAYGPEKSFITYGTVTDIDGNIYKTILLAPYGTVSYVWMAENLKTTRYNDGTPIPLITDSLKWKSSGTDGYCWYNNDAASFKDTFGALYNFQATYTEKSNAKLNLCPVGWETSMQNYSWTFLMNDRGYDLGYTLKSITGWESPNTGATNETGFSALPGGYRDGNTGKFYGMGTSAYFSKPGLILLNDYFWVIGNKALRLDYNSAKISEFYNSSRDGFSVRCSKRIVMQK